jgi:hypothetical protein
VLWVGEEKRHVETYLPGLTEHNQLAYLRDLGFRPIWFDVERQVEREFRGSMEQQGFFIEQVSIEKDQRFLISIAKSDDRMIPCPELIARFRWDQQSGEIVEAKSKNRGPLPQIVLDLF